MLKRILNLKGQPDAQAREVRDDERPVRFVEERPNVWRVVYDDDLSRFSKK